MELEELPTRVTPTRSTIDQGHAALGASGSDALVDLMRRQREALGPVVVEPEAVEPEEAEAQAKAEAALDEQRTTFRVQRRLEHTNLAALRAAGASRRPNPSLSPRGINQNPAPANPRNTGRLRQPPNNHMTHG
jgi:hypothetical protein